MWLRTKMRVFIVLSAIFVAVATPEGAPFGQRGPVDTGPGTLTAARKYLEGRWKLRSFEVFPPGEQPILVSGIGMLTYDGFGNLTVDIRVDEETSIALRTAGVPTIDGRLATTGRTVVDMQARTLTYVIAGQPPPGAPSGPLALNRPRHWHVDGDVLTLTTKGDDGQPVSVARWERAR
jgi:hypothetical protein